MIALSCRSARDLSIGEIASAVTRSFEGYFVPIEMTEENLLGHIRLDGVDLTESRVVMADGALAGSALIARRGWASRVAAMGILPEWRGKGLGKFLMRELLKDAGRRGDHEMALEVIEQNDPAIRLYEGLGFRKKRRLVGLSTETANSSDPAALHEIDIRELAERLAECGLRDLPWPISAETIMRFTPPYRAFAFNQAYALISDPARTDVRFYSLLVEPSARQQGRAKAIIQAIMAGHPGKTWHVPAIFPEEIVGPFRAAGFHSAVLSQWQMSRDITAGDTGTTSQASA